MRELGADLWRGLDPTLIDRLRPSFADTASMVAEVRDALRSPLDEVTAANLAAAVALAVDQFLDETLDEGAGGDREMHRSQGRAQHAAGRTIEEMLRFYQLGGLATWRRIAGVARGADVSQDELAILGEALLAFVADITAAAADGYAEARSQAARTGQAHRDRLLALLVTEGSATEDVEAAVREAGWTPVDQVAVAVTHRDAGVLLLDQLPSRVLMGRRHEQTCLVIPGNRVEPTLRRLGELLGGQQVAVGPVVPMRRAALSARRAEAVWQLGQSGMPGSGSLLRASDHHIDLLLSSDLELATEFVRTALTPLDQLSASARERLLTTLAAWLAQPDQPQAIARVLHVHVQTVRYRVRQLRDLFGATVDDPEGRFSLAVALRILPLVESRPDQEAVPPRSAR